MAAEQTVLGATTGWLLVSGACVLERSFSLPLPGQVMMAYSGRAAGEGDRRGDDDDAGMSVASWGPAGRAALHARWRALTPAFSAAGAELWLRPRRGDVLSDAPGTVRFVMEAQGPVRVAADAFSILTAEMMPAAADHVVHALRVFGECNRVACVVVGNVRMDGSGEPEVVGLRDGVIDPEAIVRAVNDVFGDGVMRVVV